MQNNVEVCTKALIEAIRQSREYREFKEASAALKNNPKLKEEIDQYRKDVYRLQNDTDPDALYERTEEFHRTHMEFRRNQLVNEYLSSELAVCRMLQSVSSRVVDAVDIELDDVARDIR